MCNKNINTIFDINFSNTSDASNWNTNASNVVSTVDDKLRLIPDNQNSFFERTIGSIDANNNNLKICVDLEVLRPAGSTSTGSTIVFQFLTGSNLIGSASACITNVESSQRAEFHIERTFVYNEVSGDVLMRINVTEGFENYIELKDILIQDEFFCDDDVRTYFVFEGLFTESLSSTSAAIQLKEWKIDGQETLTSEFFNETSSLQISNISEWLYADADIDGDNRESNDVSPKSFNPFEKTWNLNFQNPVPFFGGKPISTKSGSNYGLGVLSVGFQKPKVLNQDLSFEPGAFFIDIDYTKDLRIVIDVALSSNSNPFTNTNYFRRFFIIWDVKKCESLFYYQDLISNNEVNQDHNGFLTGITDQESVNEVVQCDQAVSYTGNVGTFEYVIEYGTQTGQAGINYNAFGIPDKFTIVWNGQTYTSGFVGSDTYDQQLINSGVSPSDINTGQGGSGQLLFNKNQAFPTTAIIRVEAPVGGTGWNVSGLCPEISSNDPVEIGVGNCNTGPTTWQEVYVDTNDITNYIPQNGDIVYSDSGLQNVFNGLGQTYRMRVPSGVGFINVDYEFQINLQGVVSGVNSCSIPVGLGISYESGTAINIDTTNGSGIRTRSIEQVIKTSPVLSSGDEIQLDLDYEMEIGTTGGFARVYTRTNNGSRVLIDELSGTGTKTGSFSVTLNDSDTISIIQEVIYDTNQPQAVERVFVNGSNNQSTVPQRVTIINGNYTFAVCNIGTILQT